MKACNDPHDEESIAVKEWSSGNANLDDALSDQIKNLNLQCKTKDDVNIPDYMQNNETPFIWHTQQERGMGIDLIIPRCLEKLDELKMEVDETEFSLRRYTVLLKLVLEYSILKDLEKAWTYMNEIENWLDTMSTSKNPFYEKEKLILGHVTASTKAHLFTLDNQLEKSQKLVQQIIPLKVMSKQELAGLKMMKANFYLYSGYENSEATSVQLARDALTLEPSYPEWKYLLAKFLRQQRKNNPFTQEIPYEELKLLEEACKDSNTKYKIYLAQVYRDCFAQTMRSYRNVKYFYQSELFKQIELMSQKALNLYREALQEETDHPISLRRIGYGIMNLPKRIADYDLALKCLLRSLELSPNPITMHVLGTYYHRFGNDNKTALEYFEKTAECASVAGFSDMIRIKYLINPKYDPSEDFERGLKLEIKKQFKALLYAQWGGYYLFCKRDFLKSIEYFKRAMDLKDNSQIKNFKSFFCRSYDPIDLYKYLANEALLFLENKNTSCPKTEENQNPSDEENQLSKSGLVEDFLFKISEIDPQLVEITPDPSLLDQFLKTSKELTAKENYNRNKQKQQSSRNYQESEYRGFRGRSSDCFRRGNQSFDRRQHQSNRQTFGSGRLPSTHNYDEYEGGDCFESNDTRQHRPSTNSSRRVDSPNYQRGRGSNLRNRHGNHEIENWRKK